MQTAPLPPPPSAAMTESKQVPCPALSASAPSAPVTPVTPTPLPVTRRGGEAIRWVLPQQPLRSEEAVPCVFVGFSPKEIGKPRMTTTLSGVEVPNKKTNPILMRHQDTYLLSSPTARQGTPAQYTAFHAPLGWVMSPPARELHRVYSILNLR